MWKTFLSQWTYVIIIRTKNNSKRKFKKFGIWNRQYSVFEIGNIIIYIDNIVFKVHIVTLQIILSLGILREYIRRSLVV